MKYTTKLFSLITAILIALASGAYTNVYAQKTAYISTNGTVYNNYHGSGEVACKDCETTPDVYCYQCRAFHKSADYAYYNNRENCTECVGKFGGGHHHEGGCHKDCKEYTPDLYNMDHEYDDCGGDYIVKYRGSKVKIKCNSCNAKWKYYYNDYHSNTHYVYDKDDRVIVSYYGN